MNFLVCYDVPMDCNKERNKIAKICKNFGLLRMQYSVFWGQLSTAEAKELALQAAHVVGSIPVDIRFIAVCNDCFGKCFTVIHNQQIETSGVESLNANPLFTVLTHTTVGWDPNDRRVTGFPRSVTIRSSQNQNISHENANTESDRQTPEIHISKDIRNSNSEDNQNTSSSLNIENELLPSLSFELPDDLSQISFDQMLELTGMKNLSTEPWNIPELEESNDLMHPTKEYLININEKTKINQVTSPLESKLTQGKICRFEDWDNGKNSPAQPEFQPLEQQIFQEDIDFFESDQESDAKNQVLSKMESSNKNSNENQTNISPDKPHSDTEKINEESTNEDGSRFNHPIHRGIADLDILII